MDTAWTVTPSPALTALPLQGSGPDYITESRALLKFAKSGSLAKTYRFQIHFFSLLEVGRGA